MSWEKVELGELCEIKGGAPAPQNDNAFNNGEIPFVRMKDLGRYHLTNNLDQVDQKLSREEFNSRRYEIIPKGSILMPRSGSVALNHRAILGIDAVIVSHICALVIKSDRIDNEFLYYLLTQTDMRKFTKKTTGLDSINFSDIRTIKIPLPPLAEQKRIAEVLDKADALREKRRRALQKLDTLLQSIFLEMFGDPVKNSKNFPFLQISMLTPKDDKINYGVVQPGDDYPDGYPLVRVGDFVSGKVNQDTIKKISPVIESSYKRSRLKGNEILISCVGSIGNIAIVDDKLKGFNIARAVARVPLGSVDITNEAR